MKVLAEPGRSTSKSFEAFIYAWIAFNGWASCCCDEDKDEVLIKWLASDQRLQSAFEELRAPRGRLVDEVQNFGALWPIFQASHVRRSHDIATGVHARGGRRALVDFYCEQHPEAKREPNCHGDHPDGVEPDWLHTLRALYRVRNNLFHGTKSAYDQTDREVVVAAAAVLVPTVQHLIGLNYD